jgi:PhnO protein
VIVREAVPEDYKSLLSLYNDFLETDKFSNLGNDSFQKVLASKNNFVLVAEHDSKLAGFITASARLVVRHPQPIMQVDELYVDPAFRNHGVGKKLILGIEALAKKNYYHRVYVESGYQHEPAHGFYEKNGYEKTGYYFLKVL